MKKLLSLALVLIMTLSMCVLGASAAAGDTDAWDGTADTSWYDPSKTAFEISTAEQLAGVAELVSQDISFEGIELRLTADLSLNTGDSASWATSAPANTWKPIGSKEKSFKGTFDGQGHTVSGIYIYGPGNADCSFVGLFGGVGGETDYAVIRNVTITNSYIEAYARAGLLTGYASKNVKIENVRATGKVIAMGGYPSTKETFAENPITGGVIGFIENAYDVLVSGCSFSGYVEGFVRTGGVIGSATGTYVAVENCYSDAEVVGKNRIGGIFGHANVPLVEITNCVFAGTISHSQYGKNYGAIMGGFRADATSELLIKDCYYDARFSTLDKESNEWIALPARVAVTEKGVMSGDSTWYTPQADKSEEKSGNDEDGCEATVTVSGAGAKDAFVGKLDASVWDTATLKLKAMSVNETAVTDTPVETTAAPEETTAAPEETTAAPTGETTAAPTDTNAPAETTAAPADETTAAPTGETTAAPTDTNAPATDDVKTEDGGSNTALIIGIIAAVVVVAAVVVAVVMKKKKT